MDRRPVIINSEAVLAEGVAALSRIDPVMARLIGNGALPPMRQQEPGFAGLCRIVTGQQLSTASADAIWKRVCDHFKDVTPPALLAAEAETLRSLGMSRAKIRTLQALAKAVAEGRLPLETLHEKGAEDAHALLTAVHGIGPWTADLYLMFCLDHADIFPGADLALQEAFRIAYGHEARPSVKAFTAFAECWKPWRAVAARILWAYYRQVKSREGVLS